MRAGDRGVTAGYHWRLDIVSAQPRASILPAQHVCQTDKSHVGQLKSPSVPRLKQLLAKISSDALHL